jgi:two-component system chemotaxis sensor kinase CheA
VQVEVAHDCILKGARAFLVLKRLAAVAPVVGSEPPETDLRTGQYEEQFRVFFAPGTDPEALQAAANSVAEVIAATARPVGRGEAVPPTPPAVRQEPPAAPLPAVEPSDEEATPVAGPVAPVVRIKVALLDQLLEAMADLVINRSHLAQVARKHALPDLKEAVEAHASAMSRLQETVLAMRMTPVAQVFNRFPRMVRDLAHQQGKEVRFEMEGTELELDRTILEKITDPLVHMLRNAVDHGVEPPEERRVARKPAAAHIRLQARRAQDKAIIEVHDDGQGMSPQKIVKVAVERGLITAQEAADLDAAAIFELICRPGFSTKTEVTGVSGRGVGMEVVKQTMDEIGGTLEIESQPGQGSCFRLILPLTMAILPVLLVRVGKEVYALPLTHVVRTIEPLQSDVRQLHHQPVLRWDDKILPLVTLGDLLEVTREKEAAEEALPVVVVERGRQQVGLVVDEILGKEEIVLKPLEGILGQIEGLAGATIRGEGGIVLVLDVAGLVRLLEPPRRQGRQEI